MKTMKESKKLAPITPGEILREEFLKPMGITQSKLAYELSISLRRVKQIVRGEREITANTASKLGEYFNIEPEFWLNLQASYNLKSTTTNLKK